MSMHQAFANLEGHSYMSLTTYRKSGQPVPTPVWFVAEGSKLYLLTLGDAGKVKRIRNQPQVMVAPCKANGEVLGEAVAGMARVLDADSGQHANRLLTRKYGVFKRLFDLVHRVTGRYATRVYIEIVPR